MFSEKFCQTVQNDFFALFLKSNCFDTLLDIGQNEMSKCPQKSPSNDPLNLGIRPMSNNQDFYPKQTMVKFMMILSAIKMLMELTLLLRAIFSSGPKVQHV
jgi:hypothetical protein